MTAHYHRTETSSMQTYLDILPVPQLHTFAPAKPDSQQPAVPLHTPSVSIEDALYLLLKGKTSYTTRFPTPHYLASVTKVAHNQQVTNAGIELKPATLASMLVT
jgi:hypothetical protein